MLTVNKEEGDWEFELCLAKEQEKLLPLLPLTLSTKQCESTELGNSSGCAKENPRKNRLNLFPQMTNYQSRRDRGKCMLM